MSQHILITGLNHATAPIQIREQVALQRPELVEALPRLVSPESNSPLTEAVILSTCNRTEIYAITNDLVGGERYLDQFLEIRNERVSAFITECLYTYHDREATQHLSSVACGLDSMILGEFEILGQVRSAHEVAEQHKTTGPILTALFNNAIHTGKRARSETAIGRGAASIAYAAVNLAREEIGDLRKSAVLVIGSGEMGRRVVKNLSADGVQSLAVTNRTFDHAVETASALGGKALPFSELETVLSHTDVVISATDSPDLVLSASVIARAMSARPDRSLCLIDIALPRDIDPAAVDIPNVHVFDLDDLKHVAEENIAEREKEVTHVQAIIAEEIEKFWRWYLSRRAAPVIAALHGHAETIRVEELDKALRRLGHLNLSERDRNVIAALSASILSKLLAAPTAHLKEHTQSGDGQVYLETLRELFELSDDDSDVPPTL